MTDPLPLTQLSTAARAQALARFALLRSHLEDGVPLPSLARQQGIPLRTARRWVQQYQHQGLAGLARQPRADRCARRVEPQLAQLVQALALQTPPPSAAFVHRQVGPVAAQHGWPAPSYSTVYALVATIDPGLCTLAHQGPKVYREAFDLLYRREASGPNEMWQADHCLLDLWVLDDQQRPARPWLTVILNDYSRAVAGYRLSFQAPSALQTALALRQAIWRKPDPAWPICGIPAFFYTDHGSDFTSRHLEQVSADLKIQLIFSHPGQPRGCGRIERFFNTVNQLFLCSQPGYTPPGSPAAVATLTLPTLEDRWRTFLLHNYQQRPHSETGVAPQGRWEAGGFLPQLPESLEHLDLLLLTVAKTRRVQQDGIRFQGLRYLDLTLAAYVGEDVTIRYDPRDMAEIRVYHQERFVCRAICQELAGQMIGLKEILATRRQRHQQLRTQLSTHAAVIETFLEVHQAPDPSPPSAPEPLPTPRLKRYIHE